MFGECHAHIFMNGINYREAVKCHKDGADEKIIREHLEAYRKAGVNFVRDGGDPYGASVLARKLAPEYGIDYRTPVFAIHKTGPVSYTHLTLPTIYPKCRSRWSPYH